MALALSPLSQVCKGIRAYLDGEINAPITIARAPTLAGHFVNAVYLDGWGARAEYDSQSDRVVIVPAPSVLSCLVGTVLWGISIRATRPPGVSPRDRGFPLDCLIPCKNR